MTASLDEKLPDAGIIVAEASTPEDLAHWAERIDPLTLAAGGADFFSAVMALHGPARGNSPIVADEAPSGRSTLFVRGSATACDRSRREEYTKYGVPTVLVPQTASGSDVSSQPEQQAVDAVVKALDRVGIALVGAAEIGSSSTVPCSALRPLIETVAQVLDRTNVARLFVEGGGIASALVRRMGWTHASVSRQYAPGVVAMRVPSEPPVTLTTKPGSYRWPPGVWQPTAGR